MGGGEQEKALSDRLKTVRLNSRTDSTVQLPLLLLLLVIHPGDPVDLSLFPATQTDG